MPCLFRRALSRVCRPAVRFVDSTCSNHQYDASFLFDARFACHAIIYSWTFEAPFQHPLDGKKYIGQTVRCVDSYEKALERRCQEHRYSAKSSKKAIGFRALLSEYPESWKVDILDKALYECKAAAVAWANVREKEFIKGFGGPMRDTRLNIDQTLNLTHGGRGRAEVFVRSLEVHSSKKWEQLLNALCSFKVREGHCLVPIRHYEGTYPLGSRVSMVRAKETFVAGRPDRSVVLNEMGFVMNMRDHKWANFIRSLQGFKSREGHCDVPSRHVENGYALGQAVAKVRHRQSYVRDHPSRLRTLQNMGFSNVSQGMRWLGFLKSLRSFKSREGHCCVPYSHREHGYALGTAVFNVRSHKSFVRDRPERLRTLQDVGFVMASRQEKTWLSFLQALNSFQSREGHCRVPPGHREGDYKLGQTLKRIRWRGDFLKGRPERIGLLVNMAFFNDQKRWNVALLVDDCVDPVSSIFAAASTRRCSAQTLIALPDLDGKSTF